MNIYFNFPVYLLFPVVLKFRKTTFNSIIGFFSSAILPISCEREQALTDVLHSFFSVEFNRKRRLSDDEGPGSILSMSRIF